MVRFQFCNINMANRVQHDWCRDKKGSFDTLAAAAVNFASFRQFFPAKYYFVQTIKKVTLKHHLEIAIHYKSFWISTHSNRMPLLLLWIVSSTLYATIWLRFFAYAEFFMTHSVASPFSNIFSSHHHHSGYHFGFHKNSFARFLGSNLQKVKEAKTVW